MTCCLEWLGSTQEQGEIRTAVISNCAPIPFYQLLRSSLVNNRTQAKVAEELGMQEYAITNDKTKRPVALRTKTLADLLECESYLQYKAFNLHI